MRGREGGRNGVVVGGVDKGEGEGGEGGREGGLLKGKA